MNTYEIRTLGKGENPPPFLRVPHISDHAAVRRARDLAGDTDAIEVWHGANCVYAGLPTSHLALTAPTWRRMTG